MHPNETTGKAFWGKHYWRVIETFSLSGNPAFETFMLSLSNLIPCMECSSHLKQNMRLLPFPRNRNYFLWAYELHDSVNKTINKVSPAYETVAMTYRRISPAFWGTSFWIMLHSIAIAYNPGKMDSFLLFLYTSQKLIPDKQSKETLAFLLRVMTPNKTTQLQDNKSLFFWTYQIHDAVNRQLSKRSPTYGVVKAMYIRRVGTDCENCKI